MGMAPSAGLGTASSRMVAEGHRGGVGRELRGGVPVDQARPRGRRRAGTAHAATAGRPREADGRAARADPDAVGLWRAGVWVPRRCLDGQAHRGGALARLRSALPPRSCQSAAAPSGLEPAAAHSTSQPTRRGGHPSLARGALARHQKKAAEEGYTLVWGDESGFYLLPHAVRTSAPPSKTPALRVKLTPHPLPAI